MAAELKVANDAIAMYVPRVPERGGVMLHSVEDAMNVVAALGDCNLLPDGIKSKGDAFMIVMAGAELGMGPMASIRSLHIIKGKVTMSAELILGMLLSQGVRARWVTATNEAAELELTRHGSEPHRESFTMEDARRAQLTKSGGMFEKYPKAMLRARCISAAARAYAPDLMAGGGVYTPEELETVEQVKPLSAVQQDVRDENPAAYDAAMDAHDEERGRAEAWFNGQKAVLDNLMALGQWLKNVKPATEEERDTHLSEVSALYEELSTWIDLHSADYRALNSKAGIPMMKKAGTRLKHAAEACGISLSEMKQKITNAAAAIDADNGSEGE